MPDYKKNTDVRNSPTPDDATLMNNLRGQPAAPSAPPQVPGATPVPSAPFGGLSAEEIGQLPLDDERIGVIFAEAMTPGTKPPEYMAAIVTLQERLQAKQKAQKRSRAIFGDKPVPPAKP
tara:strand:+ start:5151 stop:5510 length:360 start_codon:yes stop_codon:yes gene_type:complete